MNHFLYAGLTFYPRVIVIFLLGFINFNTMRLLFVFVGLIIYPMDCCGTHNLSDGCLWDSQFQVAHENDIDTTEYNMKSKSAHHA